MAEPICPFRAKYPSNLCRRTWVSLKFLQHIGLKLAAERSQHCEDENLNGAYCEMNDPACQRRLKDRKTVLSAHALVIREAKILSVEAEENPQVREQKKPRESNHSSDLERRIMLLVLAWPQILTVYSPRHKLRPNQSIRERWANRVQRSSIFHLQKPCSPTLPNKRQRSQSLLLGFDPLQDP